MTPSAGTRLGPYEILSPLGAGGMGEVYRARDTRLEREVAVKVLPEHLARDPAALARFEREARAVAALSHPNILALYDVGVEQGVSYAVLELLEGETLRQRLQAGALVPARVFEIASAVAEGLAAAHAKGITHRDLKPENLFLTSDGRVKILDFGLARAERAASDAAETATQPGTILGTAGYMSPEQVRGEPARGPSDIFSFGCVLYEMVTGRRAFQRSSAADTLSAILRDDPPAPEAPAELQTIIQHCLEKNPEQRFQSARDLAFALKTAAGAGARSAENTLDSIAVLPFVNAGRDPDADYLSDGITESIINSLARLPHLRVTPRSTVFRYKGQDVDPQAVGRELGAKAVLSGRVIQRGDILVVATELIDVARQSQLWGERFNRKFSDIFTIEEEIAGRISESLRGKLTGEERQDLLKRSTRDSEAYQLYLKGRYALNKRTLDNFRQAIQYFEQAIAKDPGYALAYSGLADCYGVLALWSTIPGRQAYAKAKDAALRAVELDPGLAEGHVSLGFVRGLLEHTWPEAEREFRRAIELNPGYWQAYSWFALFVLNPLGRFDEAVLQVRKALELEPLSPVVNHHAALLFLLARRPSQTIDCCRKTLEIEPDFALVRFWMGLALEQQERYQEAILEIQRTSGMRGEFPLWASSLGHAYAVSGNRAEAEKILSQMQEQPGDRYLDPFLFSVLHAGLGQPDDVFPRLLQACEDRSALLPLFIHDPRLDPVRSDPRFQDVLRRLGLA